MDKGLFVKDILPDQPASGLFIIRKAETRKTRAGGIFWSLLLVDATGEIEGKIWKPELCGLATLPEEGGILEVESGSGSLYKNQRQLSIEKARLLTEIETGQLDQSWFRATSAKNTALMWEELTALCEQEFQEAAWHDFVFSVFEDFELTAAFCSCPGAISVHHAYLGGLLEHTLGVFTLCRQFADLYPELDRKVLLAGALFHDLGKIREYAYAVDISATDEGRLLGHLIMGVMLLEPFLHKAAIDENSKMQIKHLILSHHGELTYGACVQPMTQEAIALHFADNLDAKMAICRKQMSAHQGSGHWTEAVYALDGRRLYCAKSPAERGVESVPEADAALAGQAAQKSFETPSAKTTSPQSLTQKPSEAPSPLADSEQREKGKARLLGAHGDASLAVKPQEPKAAGFHHGLGQAPEKKPAASPKLTGDEELDYEGFHFCDSEAKANAPQEDLPASLLAQWDEEDIAQGQPDLGELPDAFADDLRSQNVSKKAPRQVSWPKPEARQQKQESVALPQTGRAAWETKKASSKDGVLQAREANAGQSGLEPAGEAWAAESSQLSEAKVEEETKTRTSGSLSKEATDKTAASETLSKAFAADPELHFCDDDLLESFAQSEDLPDLTKLKEQLAAEAKQDEELRAEQALSSASALAENGKERDFSGTKPEDSKVSESSWQRQEPDREPELTDKPAEALDDKGVQESSVSGQSPEQGQVDFAADQKRLEKSPDSLPDAQASEKATGNAAESAVWHPAEAPAAPKPSALPAWAQEPPKKKRATRKKNAAQAGISLLA